MPRPPSALETFAAQKAAEEKAASQAIATASTASTTPAPAAQPEVQAKTAVALSTPIAPAATTTAPPAAATLTLQDNTAASPTAQATPIAGTGDTPPDAENTSNTSTSTPGATQDGNQASAATTVTTAANTSAITAPAPTPIEGDVNVKLEFTQDVWMQVKDETKKTLFESTNTAGTTKEFKATTPLNFKVGNAPGVKVYLNGQLYDQTPYTKGSVARFKVE
jgi:hypothetical protein